MNEFQNGGKFYPFSQQVCKNLLKQLYTPTHDLNPLRLFS